MVAGIIAAAVADEFVLHHPDGHADNQTMITVPCGAALFLIGNLLFKWAITGCWARSHVIGLILLALLVPVACHLSPVVLSLSATLVLIGMAAWEHQAASSTPTSRCMNEVLTQLREGGARGCQAPGSVLPPAQVPARDLRS